MEGLLPFSSLLAAQSTGGRYLYAPTPRQQQTRSDETRTIASLTNRDHLAIVRLAEAYVLFVLRRTLMAKGGHSSFSSDNIHGDNTDGRKHSTDDDSRRNRHHKSRNMRAGAFCG